VEHNFYNNVNKLVGLRLFFFFVSNFFSRFDFCFL